MADGVASPVPGFHVSRLLDQDGAATSYLGALAAGRAGVLTVGHRVLVSPTDSAAFQGWTGRLAGVSGHPGIADLLGRGLTPDSRPYLITATSGATLATTLRGDGARGPDEVRAIGVAIADALAAVHAAGLAHGAVRPATILLTPGPQLAGFDATAPGLAQPLASSPYTAPEHLAAAAAGHVVASGADDVYALALTLYVALGGRPPWATDDGSGITDPALRGQPVPDVPGVSPAFLAALRAALTVNAPQRPTAAVFRDALAAVAAPAAEPAGKRGKAVTPIALALLAGAGARPVAEAVISAVTSATTGTGTGAAGAAGVASGGIGAAGYATAANPGIGVSEAVGASATSGVGGGAAGATAGTGAVAAGGAATGGVGGAVAGTGAVGTAAVGLGVGAKIAVAAALVATVGGGGAAATYYASGAGDGKPAATQPSKLDQSIRKVDFKNITLRDGDRQVKLTNGERVTGTGPAEFRYALSIGPAYADVDGDGDEDAAIAYTVTNGNGWQQYGYIWRWENGKPVQMQEPFSRDGRCGTTYLKSLTSGKNGIAVRVDLIDLSQGCAGRPAGSDAFTLGVREGYPVRVAPQLGPVESCDTPSERSRLGPRSVTPRVAPHPKAPAMGAQREFAEVVILSDSSTEVDGYNWFLAVLTAADGKRTCGWISGQEIGSD